MSEPPGCTEACWTPTRCPVCGREQAPRGRAVPLAGAGAYCDEEHCGTTTKRHLWDEHDSDRWYVDRDGWAEHERTCASCGGES